MNDIRQGKMSTFGGPDDDGVSSSEGLSLVNNKSQLEELKAFFLDKQPPGTTGYAKRLNPDTFYIACRWDFGQTSKKYLRSILVTVSNPANGKSEQAKPIDFGPATATGRVADLSPGLAKALGLDTDEQCIVEIPLPGVAQPSTGTALDGLPVPSPYASQLATVARLEYEQFGGTDESDSPLLQRIKQYYTALGFTFESEEVPWSAVFVSFCVKEAGAKQSEFKFSMQHSQFVFKAIQNADANAGVFRGYDFRTQSVRVGDILHNNRPGGTYDFDDARANKSYPSHSAIVIARGVDDKGKFALTVGGNEQNTVRRRRVPLNDDGTPKQRSDETFISIIKNLK